MELVLVIRSNQYFPLVNVCWIFLFSRSCFLASFPMAWKCYFFRQIFPPSFWAMLDIFSAPPYVICFVNTLRRAKLCTVYEPSVIQTIDPWSSVEYYRFLKKYTWNTSSHFGSGNSSYLKKRCSKFTKYALLNGNRSPCEGSLNG